MTASKCAWWMVAVMLAAVSAAAMGQDGQPWARHVVDSAFAGPDGTRLMDINGDGRPDVAVGCEEGKVVRVYLMPAPDQVRRPWPGVTVGQVASPEDAVFVDLDGDGAVDVVSCAEGSGRVVTVHWAPKDRARLLDESAWVSEPIPASVRKMGWMFCAPADINGDGRVELVCAGKGRGAEIGIFLAPENPRDLAKWTWRPLRPAAWVMSVEAVDMDGDGDLDILFTDRKGDATAVGWLENPGTADGAWTEHRLDEGAEFMFLTQADLDGDGLVDVVTAIKEPNVIRWYRRLDATGTKWARHDIAMPENAGTAKAVAVADIDGDGRLDIIFSCEWANVRQKLSGVMWLSYRQSPTEPVWQAHDISGVPGVKYDLVVPIDLDGDGDLDILTSEETDLNAIIWYENPTK